MSTMKNCETGRVRAVRVEKEAALSVGSASSVVDDKTLDTCKETTSLLKSARIKKALGNMKGGHARLGKGGKGRRPMTLEIPLVFPYLAQSATGGVYQRKFSGADLSGLAEFTDLSGIFEIMRVTAMRVYWQPCLFGAALDDAAAGHDLFHQPCVAVLDPDIPVATTNSYATLVATVVPSDPNVSFKNTSQPWKKAYKSPPAVLNNSAAPLSVWSWQNPGSMATSLGGVSWAARTDAAAGTNGILGQFLVEFVTEWTYRQ